MNEGEPSIGWMMLTAENQITWRITCPSVVSLCFPQIPYIRTKSSHRVSGRLLSVGAKARPHTCLVLRAVSNDTELSPSQVAQSYLASTEFPHLLFKTNVHYLIQNSSQLGPILRQHNLEYIFLKNNRIRLANISFNNTEFLTIWKIHSKYFMWWVFNPLALEMNIYIVAHHLCKNVNILRTKKGNVMKYTTSVQE